MLGILPTLGLLGPSMGEDTFSTVGFGLMSGFAGQLIGPPEQQSFPGFGQMDMLGASENQLASTSVQQYLGSLGLLGNPAQTAPNQMTYGNQGAPYGHGPTGPGCVGWSGGRGVVNGGVCGNVGAYQGAWAQAGAPPAYGHPPTCQFGGFFPPLPGPPCGCYFQSAPCCNSYFMQQQQQNYVPPQQGYGTTVPVGAPPSWGAGPVGPFGQGGGAASTGGGFGGVAPGGNGVSPLFSSTFQLPTSLPPNYTPPVLPAPNPSQAQQWLNQLQTNSPGMDITQFLNQALAINQQLGPVQGAHQVQQVGQQGVDAPFTVSAHAYYNQSTGQTVPVQEVDIHESGNYHNRQADYNVSQLTTFEATKPDAKVGSYYQVSVLWQDGQTRTWDYRATDANGTRVDIYSPYA